MHICLFPPHFFLLIILNLFTEMISTQTKVIFLQGWTPFRKHCWENFVQKPTKHIEMTSTLSIIDIDLQFCFSWLFVIWTTVFSWNWIRWNIDCSKCYNITAFRVICGFITLNRSADHSFWGLATFHLPGQYGSLESWRWRLSASCVCQTSLGLFHV